MKERLIARAIYIIAASRLRFLFTVFDFFKIPSRKLDK
jgi:hypothetical protein